MNKASILDNLQSTSNFLSDYGSYFLSPETLADFANRVQELLDSARSPGEVLYVGILGGTGVGKSSLINALARAKISDSSDRRPFTDKAVVYRHEASPRGLDHLAPLFRPQDSVHKIEEIKDLILVDLPDFDSLERSNKETVVQILPFLDAIIWTLSPEKYADAEFYRFAREAPVDPANFTFVLNKADELISDEADGYGRLKDVVGDLTFRLRQSAGVSDPRLFYVSALQEYARDLTHPVLDSEFARLREFLMARRDAKEIAGIKMSNLVGKAGELIKDLKSAVGPEGKMALLGDLQLALRSPVVRPELTAFEIRGLKERLSKAAFEELVNRDQSVGLVRTAVQGLHRIRSIRSGTAAMDLKSVALQIGQKLAEHHVLYRDHRLQRIDTELAYCFSRTDMWSADEPDKILERSTARAIEGFESRFRDVEDSVAISRAGRFFQRLWLWTPAPFLFLRLSGANAIHELSSPTLWGLLKILIAIPSAFFGPEGLIGILALIIWEALIVSYLAGRRLKKFERGSLELAESAFDGLQSGVRSTMDECYSRKQDLLNRLIEGMALLKEVNL